MPITTYIALGSNLGDRMANLADALKRIGDIDSTEVVAVSKAYESEPWGTADPRPFANAVAAVWTSVPADSLLGVLKQIELDLGREPGEPNAPRTIDLDILLYGDEEWESVELSIPHPRMAERDFVITPLLKIAPDATYPDGTPVTRDRVSVGRITSVIGDIGARIAQDDLEASDDEIEPGTQVPERRPLPGEDWVRVYEYGVDPTFWGLVDSARSGDTVLGAAQPNVGASFVQVVLTQEGIPFLWDPFPPEQTSDPYGFGRRFHLKVPASMESEARHMLEEASTATIDWSDVDFGD